MINEKGGDEPLRTPVPAGVPGATTLEGITAAWHDATDALRESERRYRELVESSLGLICTHDLEGTILSINPAAANSLKYRPEDGVGRNLRDFLAPDKRALFDDYLRRIREHGRDEGLMSVVDRDGRVRVWMYRNVLSHGSHGAPYILGHAIDVTDRIAAERTLRHSEQALRTAQAELEQRVRDRTTELEEANRRLRVEIAEREAAERSRERALIEQRDTVFFLGEFSDRLAPLVTFEQLVDVIRRLPVPFLADATLVHIINDDGSTRVVPGLHGDSPLELPHGSETSAGDPRCPCHLHDVIGSRKRTVLDQARLASRPLGPGAEGVAQVVGARAAAMLPLVFDGRVKAVLSLLSTSERRFSDAGMMVLDDVARRLRLALDRIELYREVQEANRLKDEFLGTLSHELRTPLNAIFGWARILRARNLDERTAHAVEVIERNAQVQIRLIEEVLDVSRIITGKMALAMEIADVAAIVRATIDVVRPAIHAKRIRLKEAIEPVPPVLGDENRLQQVFWNVLSNALKFTGTDGTITVAVRSIPGRVEFEVTDTGVGIRREVLPFVFDRFWQADSSTTRTHGGLGLGLAIVRHIVELHGGTVRATSAGEGLGATFTIQLPMVQGHDLTTRASGTEGRTEVPSSKLRGRVILVVEDHEDARELIAAVLEAAGARVLAASSTTEAIVRVGQTRPDVLLADLGLPGEDGYALLKRVRQLYPDVPAIALTAYARSTDHDRALAAGFQRHVVKPVDPRDLVEHVIAVL